MLHIVLTDDWELRGNGSGNPRAMQVRTARALMDLYERFGLRCSFNVEVLQQLAFREAAGKPPELGAITAGWDAGVREMLGGATTSSCTPTPSGTAPFSRAAASGSTGNGASSGARTDGCAAS